MTNEAQKEFWNGSAGDVWVEAQGVMDYMLAPLSDATIAAAAPQSNEKIIDVGCGCGATTLAIAESGASVWGVDISEPMVARARDRAVDLDNISFSVADASLVKYAPEHHLIFSRFGVMFFDDPEAAFSNLRSALVQGGRLTFVCWQSPKQNPFMSVAGKAVRRYMPESEQRDPREPGPFAFADRSWIIEILGRAGFSDIVITSLTPDLTLGKTLDESMYFQTRVGPVARVLAELDESLQVKAKQAVQEALSEYVTDAGVILPSAAWLVQAKNLD